MTELWSHCPHGPVAPQCSDSTAEPVPGGCGNSCWTMLCSCVLSRWVMHQNHAAVGCCPACSYGNSFQRRKADRQTPTEWCQVLASPRGSRGSDAVAALVLTGLVAAAAVTPAWGCGEHGWPRGGLFKWCLSPLEGLLLNPHNLRIATQAVK